MQSINFESGNIKEYAINGDESNTIRIDVSDLGFVDRFRTAMRETEGIQKKYSGIEAPSEDILSELDKAARSIVNKAFDSDVCTAAFGNKNCMSVASNGQPVLLNFLNALIPVIREDFGSAFKEQQLRSEEKTDKYIKPITSQPAAMPRYAGMVSQPAIDIDSLTKEQKNAILAELLK